MLSREENDLLTQTGPGTPMGEVMRRYWIPALLSREIANSDGPPVRVKLLGEALIMFRDTEGRIGLLDEFCAHRGTSLWLGRNEQGGLRCIWHGWKYDVTGQCVHQLNETDESTFAHKIRLKSYPTCELGGVIWTHMGPPEKKPAPPRFGWTQVPETHRHVSKVIEECNWLQALEGGLDQSHVGILHKSFRDNPANPGSGPDSFNARRIAVIRSRTDTIRSSLRCHQTAGRTTALRAGLQLCYALYPDTPLQSEDRGGGRQEIQSWPHVGTHR
jgi:phthalate 4,5-dioxygenase